MIEIQRNEIRISKNFQEIAKHTEILNAISTDHSPVYVHFKTLIKVKEEIWKFNNSLVSNKEYVLRLKELVTKVKGELNRSNHFCDQVK